MKSSAIAATLAAVLPLALADGNRPFQLRVPQDGPAEIAGQFVTKNTDSPASPYLGFGVGGEPWTATIKDEANPTHGEVVDAEDANAPLYVLPTLDFKITKYTNICTLQVAPTDSWVMFLLPWN